jgi:small-conductance mechanosensitive channel
VAAALQFAAVVGGLYGVARVYEIDPTVVLACIAIVTAGISLHAGQIIEASIAGAVLLASGRISVGEQVTVAGGISGIVTEIGFSDVLLDSNTEGRVSVPSSKIVGDVVINHSRLPAIDMSIEFPFHNEHSSSEAIGIISEVLKSSDLSAGSKILHQWVGGSETYSVVVKVGDYSKRRQIMSALSERITRELFKAGLPLGSVSYVKSI